MEIVQQILAKEGRIVDLLFQIRPDIRMVYLNELSSFLNKKREMQRKEKKQQE